MSASQRILPVLAAAALGCISGSYIFAPILKQYAADTGGTFRPEDIGTSSSSSSSSSSSPSSPTDDVPSPKTFTSKGTSVDAPSGNLGSISLSLDPSSATSSNSESHTQARAERVRELAVANASARAVEALQSRARKTGEGEIFDVAKAE